MWELAYAYCFVALGFALRTVPLVVSSTRLNTRAIGISSVAVGMYVGSFLAVLVRSAIWPATLLSLLRGMLSGVEEARPPLSPFSVRDAAGRVRFRVQTTTGVCVVCGQKKPMLFLSSADEPRLFGLPDGWFSSEQGHVCSTRCAARLPLQGKSRNTEE